MVYRVTPPTERHRNKFHDLLETKAARARLLGVAKAIEGDEMSGYSFILSGPDGAIDLFQLEDGNHEPVGARVAWYRPGQSPLLIDTTQHSARYVDTPTNKAKARMPVDRDTFLTLIDQIKRMEVAPQKRVPYGFVRGTTVVGIAFLNTTPCAGTRRTDMGYVMDSYFVYETDVSLEWEHTSDPAKWLANFWKRYERGEVVNLVERVKQLEGSVFAEHVLDSRHPIIHFVQADGNTPVILTDAFYAAPSSIASDPAFRARHDKLTMMVFPFQP